VLPETFQDQLEESRTSVFRFLHGLTRDAVEAEDLTQECLLVAWRKRELYATRECFSGYLRRTAFRVYLSHRRKQWRRHRIAPVVADADLVGAEGGDDLARTEALAFFLERTREALAELPESQRQAFVLFRFEGLSCEAISERTGAPPKTVATRVRRATLHLAKRLRKHKDLLRS
jgi:RNA polymerase sigma-70 factor (ECF subfamily)